MTSRERVRAVLDGSPADRAPVDFGGTNVTAIHPSAYHRVKRLLGVSGGHTRVYDVEGLAAEVELEVARALGSDVLYVKRLRYRYGVPNDSWRAWRLADGTPVEVAAGYDLEPEPGGGWRIEVGGRIAASMPGRAAGFDPVPAAGVRPDPASIVFPSITEEDCRHLEATSRAAFEGTDLALAGEWHGKGLLGAGCLYTHGMEGFLCDLLVDPGYAADVLDRYTEHYRAELVPFFQAVADRLDVYCFYDDFGTQSAPLISPELFRAFFAPRYRSIMDDIRRLSRARVFFHSCGAIRPLIPDMIAMGVRCLNPLQPGLPGMAPESLKAEHGERLVFWGGAVNAQSTLETGTPGAVREEARRNAAILGRGGGYVFAASHNVQRDVPAENVLALFEAGRRTPGR
jgi:uroporphyrinogen decarboxylase